MLPLTSVYTAVFLHFHYFLFDCNASNLMSNRYVGRKVNANNYDDRGQILLDKVHCHGNETHIRECSHGAWGVHNCTHNEDVAVACMDFSNGDERYFVTLCRPQTLRQTQQTTLVFSNELQCNKIKKKDNKEGYIRTVPGKRRQGGQRKQWFDDVTQWIGKDLPTCYRLAEGRNLFRHLIRRVA